LNISVNTVEIHPYFAPFHASFFMEGLRTVFGPANVKYSARSFPNFKRSGFLKFIIRGKNERRFFVDEWDTPTFEQGGLDWCDVYAKRNIDPARMPSQHAERIVPAGPTFPVRFAAPGPALCAAIQTWMIAATRASSRYGGYAPSREHFASWYRQWSYGLPLSVYEPGVSRAGYVFFSSSIWKEDGETNQTRAHFIEACRSIPGLSFEGGFTPRSKGHVAGYQHVTVDRRYTHDEFIAKTKTSAVAFNNAAVERAFSWRLGESLALGKAIVSTPLERLVPAPLIHGEHIHFVEPSVDSMRSAVERICGDSLYRQRLERGARQYYLDHVSPSAAVKRMLAAAEQHTCVQQ
jgi:hypothetical protein